MPYRDPGVKAAYMKAYNSRNRDRILKQHAERFRRLTRSERDTLNLNQRCRRLFAPEKYDGYEKKWRSKQDMTAIRRRWDGLPEPTRPEPDCCEVCGKSNHWARLHLDHNHATGKFRGWFCGNCNRAAGLLKDDPATLIALAEYLLKT